MLIQPSHHVSRQEFQNPHPPRFVEAYSAKRTLNKTHAAGVSPLYLTPVFQPGSSHTQKMQNEPNFHPSNDPNTQNEPNCPSATITTTRKMQNEPNSRPVHDPIMRNEPNLRTISAKRTQFAYTRCPTTPKKRKTNPIYGRFMRNEPNLPHPHRPTTKKRETNPIPVYQAPHHPLFQRNEPNFIPPRASCPNFAKRTQFPAHRTTED